MIAVRRKTVLMLMLGCLMGVSAWAQSGVRQVIDLDSQWRFQTGDAKDSAQPSLDDQGWQKVSLPHDWAISGPVAESNPSGQGGGFFPAGIAWYRKSFRVPEQSAGRHVYAVFDGVMANSEVWINGHSLGRRPNGSVSFFYDLTKYLKPNADNLLAVRCDTSRQPASRWYEGGGIYRPVRLVLLQDLHLEPWSVFVTTPTVTRNLAEVHAAATAVNAASKPVQAVLELTVTAPDGSQVGRIRTATRQVPAGGRVDFEATLPVNQPSLWGPDQPTLYRTSVRLIQDGKEVRDEEVVRVGLRSYHFDPDTGFWINGRNIKLFGVAVHMDGGATGIAVPMGVWERRLKALRALGVNAIRTAHNPPSPEFLDLCDRMGFLVMDELFDCWTVAKNPFDYHLDFTDWAESDVRDTVRRDRNHPSVILWSAGNEIHDTPKTELAHAILARLVATFHANDMTHPVTQALFRPNVSHDYDNGLADMLDVVGQNYREKEILAAHDQKPTRKIVGTENTHDRLPWLALRDHPAYAGQFLWTGVDYLGEAGQWPLISRPYGLLDRTGYPHPRAFERQSWWSATPAVHIVRRVGADEKSAVDPGYEAIPVTMREPLLHDWSPRNRDAHEESVEIYSNCEETELFLNGKSLGRQQKHPDATPLTWKVAYEAGRLRAVGYNHGVAAVEEELRSAGPAVRLELSADQSSVSQDRNDLVMVTAIAVDAQGVPVPTASEQVSFSTEGPGSIFATDNGNTSEHLPFPSLQRPMYAGRVVAMMRATANSGEIHLHASSATLGQAEIRIPVVPRGTLESERSF